MLTRESFFANPRVAFGFEAVEFPDVGKVIVHEMSAGVKDRWDLAYAEAKNKDFRARLIVATCHDEEGNPLFTEGDIPALSRLPIHLVEPLIEAAIRVNRMSNQDVEALAKN